MGRWRVYLQYEGWADGGVEGAHAVQNGITRGQLCQQCGIRVWEDLVVLLAVLPQVEDALDGRFKLRAQSQLVHLIWAWGVCMITDQ